MELLTSQGLVDQGGGGVLVQAKVESNEEAMAELRLIETIRKGLIEITSKPGASHFP